MALHPELGAPVLERLGPRDVPDVLMFLEDDPVLNVYLIALVMRDALARPHDVWLGARRHGRLCALVFLGGLSGAVLPAGDDIEAHRLLGHALRAAPEPRPDRLQIIGPRDDVAALREQFPGAGHDLRLEREQVYLALDATRLRQQEPMPELRNAQREDYAFLYHAGAELRAEELLEDPRELDPVAYARRVEEECRDGWTWLVRDERGLVFRAGVSAITTHAAQISGVYVPPALRGQGIARRALGELCMRLMRRSPHICLFVNLVNAPALAVYRRLGFIERSDWASAFMVRSAG
jgi:ribosomal protein S18 acetylase RimI-like enzyme